MKNCLLIINPCSGKMKIQNELFNIIRKLNEKKYNVQVITTLYHNHARKIAKEAKDYDLIICAGGDGTLNQVVSGVAEASSNIPIGYIPCGSTNDYAISLGLSSNIMEALDNIINGKVHYFDVGLLNDFDYFNYVASFGAFTAISYNTPQNMKNVFGHLAYIANGITELVKIKSYNVRCVADENEFKGDYIIGLVLNTISVGGVLKFNNCGIKLNDGLFEVILIKKPKDLVEASKIVEGIFSSDFSSDVFDYTKASNIKFYMNDKISWSLDGEEKKPGKAVRIKNLNNKIQIIY